VVVVGAGCGVVALTQTLARRERLRVIMESFESAAA
jgi:hypothetical protein